MTLDPTVPRDAVAAAGRRRLLTHGVDSLRSQLNASVLARESPVSKDTAYRVFRTDEAGEGVTDAIIAAVAGAVEEWTGAGYDAALGDAMAAYQASAPLLRGRRSRRQPAAGARRRRRTHRGRPRAGPDRGP